MRPALALSLFLVVAGCGPAESAGPSPLDPVHPAAPAATLPPARSDATFVVTAKPADPDRLREADRIRDLEKQARARCGAVVVSIAVDRAPFGEVVARLGEATGVRIALDRRLPEDVRQTPVTSFYIADAGLDVMLELLAGAAGDGITVLHRRDSVLFVARADVVLDLVEHRYAITQAMRDRMIEWGEAARLAFEAREPDDLAWGTRGTEPVRPASTASEFAGLVECNVEPSSWSVGGARIEAVGETLHVRATERVQEEVAAFLESLVRPIRPQGRDGIGGSNAHADDRR